MENMQKKGIKGVDLILLIIFIGIILSILTFVFFTKNPDSSQTEEQTIPETVAQNQTEIVSQENESQQEIEDTENNQSQTENETEESNLVPIDLEAFNLYLENNGCTNETAGNETCEIYVIGTIKNNGAETITSSFSVHLLDITNIAAGGTSLIESFALENDLASGENINVSETYRDIVPGKYWIKLKVDPHNEIKEDEEDNNEKTGVIKVA